MATRELKTRITADNSDLKRGLKDSEKQVSGFSSTVKKAGVALLGVFAAKELAQGIKRIVVDLGNMADRLLDLEQITGISTDKLQEYEQVARVAGVNSETLATAVQGLTRRLAATDTATSPLNIGLGKLGITAKTAAGEIRNGAEVMEEAIAKLAEMDNVTERNVLGAQIFGRAWMDLAPILALGADGIEKARKQAHQLGLVLDKEALEKANEFRIELETLNARLSQIGKNIGMVLIPILLNLANGFRDVKDSIREVWAAGTKDAIAGDMEEISDLAQRYLGKGLVSTLEEGQARATAALLEQLEKQRDYWQGYYGDISQLADREERVQARKRMNDLDARINALKVFKGQTVEIEKEGLGEIEQLQEDIKAKEEQYIKSNSEARRQAISLELVDMRERLRLLQEEETLNRAIAEYMRSRAGGDMAAPERMPSLPGTVAVTTPGINENFSETTRQLNEMAAAQDRAALAAQKHADMMQALSFIAQDAAFSIGEAFGQMAAKGGQATGALVAQAIAQAMAMIIRQIAATLPFPANIAAIASAGMFQGIMKSQIPAYRDGALAYGPSLGMIGEYANARTNPEVIAPLDKLQSMMGGGVGEVEFRIKGQELWGVLKKYENRLNQNS